MSNTNFPGSLDTFTNPGSSDSESAGPVPHHLQHGKLNDAVAALEAKVGVDGSAIGTSLDYLLKSPSSHNPGHVHTQPTTTQNLSISGTTAQTGAGLWTDGTVLYVTNGGTSGGVILRPKGPTNNSYQLLVTSTGHVSTSDSIGSVRNTFDDGSGNVTVAGNITIDGNITVIGSATIPLTYSSGETTTLSFDPGSTTSDGSSTDLARADHRHALPALFSGIPSAGAAVGYGGNSLLAARGDHTHPLEEAPGFIQMWPTSSIPAGYLLCNGSHYAISAYSALATALNASSPSSPAYVDGTYFQVPDFQGVSPIGAGASSAYASNAPSTRTLGVYYGSEKITIAANQLPQHSHPITDVSHSHTYGGVSNSTYETFINVPSSSIWAAVGSGTPTLYYSTSNTTFSASGSVSLYRFSLSGMDSANTGINTTQNSAAPVANSTPVMQPVYAVNFVIKT